MEALKLLIPGKEPENTPLRDLNLQSPVEVTHWEGKQTENISTGLRESCPERCLRGHMGPKESKRAQATFSLPNMVTAELQICQ